MRAKQKLSLAVAAALAGSLPVAALATTAYTDDFNRLTLNGGTYTYTDTIVGGDGGALTDGSRTNTLANTLSLTNDAGAGANASGLFHTTTPTSAYTGFNQSLSANTGQLLTWTLNMQQIRTNPSGVGPGNYGAAYVLGATSASLDSTGGGYALIIGNTGTTDAVRLYRYDSGLAAVGLTANSATAAGAPIISGAGTAGANYQSIKVTYNAITGQWSLYTRDDGATAFADPTVNTGYNFAGNSNDSTYTSSALTHSGAYWAYQSGGNQTAKFDNFLLDVSAAPVLIPRNLLWDADATGAATDGSGTWSTANTWIDQSDSSHVTWDGTTPDIATIGAGSGAGSATIDLGGVAQVAGQVVFVSGSPTYTIANGTLTIPGYDHDSNPVTMLHGMEVQQSTNIDSTLNWINTADLNVSGSGTVLTVNGALQGAGEINKSGAGTLVLNTPAPARGGTMLIDAGTVRVTSTSGGISGLGTASTSVKASATLHLDASGGAMLINTNGGGLFMGDQSTLRVTGDVTWMKNFPLFSNGPDLANARVSTLHVDAGGMLLFRSQIRNSGTTPENFHTIQIDGPGTVKLTNSGSNISGDSNIFSGSWDLSNGMLILGQNTETGGSSGDTLNALGFKNGDSRDGNTITVRGTGVLVGTENTSNPAIDPTDYYKADVIMSGGTIASGNGKDTYWSGSFTTTAASTSTVATYDPTNTTVARSTSLVNGTATLDNFQGDTSWNGNLTIDPGTTTGGAFNITRNGGTISVTPGATITVLQNATLNLDGTADALSDGTDHVNVVNNSTTSFNVSNGPKNVGDLSGVGNTTVASGSTLLANHVRQNALTLNGDAQIREQGPDGPASGVSKITSLTVAGGSKFDLKNNKLITASAIGTHNGTNYTGITGLVETGRNGGVWDGPGITTSMSDATGGSGYTVLGVATAMEARGLGASTDTDVWGGQTVTGSDTLVMYTYGGDANLSGFVDVDDYGLIDFNAALGGVLTGWYNGDFDYNGFQDVDDYGIIDFTATVQGSPFYTAGGLSIAAVPEPASIGLIGLAATTLLRRRRRAK